AVNVDTTGGTPSIQLNDSANSVATYTGGSGTSALVFSFVVPSGDTTAGTPLDYTSAAINLNSGTITDVSDSLNVDPTLPAPGSSDVNDILYSDNIQIDATT